MVTSSPSSFALAAALLAALCSALDNGLAELPPMGWMSWERFRCTTGKKSNQTPSLLHLLLAPPTVLDATLAHLYLFAADCEAHPGNCINEQLIKQHADILAEEEWYSAGYR